VLFLVFSVSALVVYDNRYQEFTRLENPEQTYVLVFLEDSWKRIVPALPGQGSDISGKIRLIDKRGKCIRQKRVGLIRQIDLGRLEWSTNSMYCIGVGEWTFDNKGSWDWD